MIIKYTAIQYPLAAEYRAMLSMYGKSACYARKKSELDLDDAVNAKDYLDAQKALFQYESHLRKQVGFKVERPEFKVAA